jgi:dTDP-4-amino-4,6-dideoxygalactose transaminase
MNIFGEVIDNSTFISGEQVKTFENEFSEYTKIKYCITCGSGTDALYIALKSLELPPCSKVLVPAMSYTATSVSISNAGLIPVFVDINENGLINIEDLKHKLNDEIKCIVVVHLYGQCIPNIEEIAELSKNHNIKLLEDCAQAHGTRNKNGIHVGNFGDISIFSFYPGKNLGAFGDGGCICTNDETLSDRCYLIANLGARVKYFHNVKGITSRLDNLNARILSFKLKNLDLNNKLRVDSSRIYDSLLNKYGTPIRDYETDTYHIYYMLVDPKIRPELIKFLNEKHIETNIHYPVALNKQKCHEDLEPVTCNKAELFAMSCISLPMFPGISEQEITYVCESIIEFFRDYQMQ